PSRAPVSPPRLAHTIDAVDPSLRGHVITSEHVVQPVRPILPQPRLLVEIAYQREPVTHVLTARIDPRDLAERAPRGATARRRRVRGVRRRVQLRDLVRELELHPQEIDPTRAQRQRL